MPAWIEGHAQEFEPLRPGFEQQLWLGARLESRLFKPPKRVYTPQFYRRFRAFAEWGYRSGENLGSPRQQFLEVGGRYRLTANLRAGLEHRYGFRGPQGQDRQRTSLLVLYRAAAGRFTFDHRLRYQHEWRPRGKRRDMIRNRFGVAYDIRKWKFDPEVSVEFFTQPYYKGWAYVGTRYSLGTSYRLAKNHTLDLEVMHDRQRAVHAPRHRLIYGLAYTWRIN